MSELGDLMNVVYEKTAAGKIDWTVDDDVSRMHAYIGKNILEIDRITTFSAQASLRNMDGIILLSEEFNSLTNPVGEKLMDLFEIARRRSLGVDEALSDLRARLNAL